MLSFWSSWLSMKWRKNAENEQGEKAGYFWRLISYESGYLRSLNFIPLLQVVITPSATEIKFRMKFRLTICPDSRSWGGGGGWSRRLGQFFSRSLTLHCTPLSERLEQARKHIDWSPLSRPAGRKRATKAGTNSWLKTYMLDKVLFELVLVLHHCISVISCFVNSAAGKKKSTLFECQCI